MNPLHCAQGHGSLPLSPLSLVPGACRDTARGCPSSLPSSARLVSLPCSTSRSSSARAEQAVLALPWPRGQQWSRASPRQCPGLRAGCWQGHPTLSVAALEELRKKRAAVWSFTDCLPLSLLRHLAQDFFFLSNPTTSIVNLLIFSSSEGRLMNVFPADQKTGSLQPSSAFPWPDNACRNRLCLFNYLPLLH